MPLITAQQAIARAIMKHPSLYASDDYELSKFRVLGQIFNVNGSGYQDGDDFLEAFMAGDGDAALPEMPPPHLVNGTPLFNGFTKAKDYGNGFKFADFNSMIDQEVREEDKADYPQVVHWQAIDPIRKQAPYPNFEKDFSTYYTIGEEARAMLDRSWLEAADWFYAKCQDYFQGDCQDYHVAYPRGSEQEDERHRELFRQGFERQRKDGMTEAQFQQAVSEAYGTPYTGDLDAFLRERWTTEKARIQAFLGQVRGDVQAQLAETTAPARTRKPGP